MTLCLLSYIKVNNVIAHLNEFGRIIRSHEDNENEICFIISNFYDIYNDVFQTASWISEMQNHPAQI